MKTKSVLFVGCLVSALLCSSGVVFSQDEDDDNSRDGRVVRRDNRHSREDLFSRDGTYSGRVENGNVYSRDGTYSGRIDKSGNVYDRSGKYVGRIGRQ